MLGFSKSRGDTMIEVLFATAAFSLVAVGGLSIMNQGSQTAQRALEITLVREEMDAQAETLRFLNSSYIAAYKPGATYSENTPAGQWNVMLNSIKATNNIEAHSFAIADGGKCPIVPSGSFIMNTHTATFVKPEDNKLTTATTFSQLRYNDSDQVTAAEGLWVEAVRSATVADNGQSNAGYIDFYIRACWEGLGQSVPITVDTVVRLYEPR